MADNNTTATTPALNLDWSRLGHISFEKGSIGDKPIIVWDGVQDCIGRECGIFDRCNFHLKDHNKGKCKIQKDYLSEVMQAIDKAYKQLDEVQLIKIGFQLIPLYSQLCRLKMIEMTVRDIVYETEKGSRLVNPVFKEIREILKAIHIMWKDVGMPPPAVSDPKIVPKKKDMPLIEEEGKKTGDTVEGDRSHIDRITARQIDRKGVIR